MASVAQPSSPERSRSRVSPRTAPSASSAWSTQPASSAFSAIERHDVIALTDSTLCLFPRRDYERAIERFPALGRALLRRTAEDLFESRATIDLMSRRNARQKVAGFILSIARAASHSPCHPAPAFELPLSREEIAGVLGLTIETVSRQLTRLDRDGLIARDGRRGIHLLNPAGLELLAA